MRFVDIVFLQGENFDDIEGLLENSFEDVVEYMSQWEFGDEEMSEMSLAPWGTSDTVFYSVKYPGYILSFNRALGYAHLIRKEG